MPCFTKLNNYDKCKECYINDTLNYLKCFEKYNYNYDNCISNDFRYINKEINLDINNILDVKVYSYEITLEKKDLQNIYINSTVIEISPKIKANLVKKFNLDEQDKIYVLILDYISNNTNIVINDYIYKFF